MKKNCSHVRLKGIAAHDPRYAGLLLPAYQEELSAVASYTYRSLLSSEYSREHSDLFDRIATDALRHFQTLGELIVALGGNPVMYSRHCEEPTDAEPDSGSASPLPGFLRQSIREEQIAIEHCETLMGKTDDRVVRSVLLQIVQEKQSHLHSLCAACRSDTTLI